MRELEQLRSRPELTVAALLALVHAHKQHKNPGIHLFNQSFIIIFCWFHVDREAITEYEVKVKELRKQVDDMVNAILCLLCIVKSSISDI